jgi:hypothetical protein
MMVGTSSFLRLKWLASVLFGLLWATIGCAATLAERSDFGHATLAANRGFRGGAHTDVQAPGIESHHMPAKSVSGLGEPNGPAIQMTPADHARTMSNGKMQGSGEYREMIGDMVSGGDMRSAIATEIPDVRRVAREAGDPRRYNGAMREMMDY